MLTTMFIKYLDDRLHRTPRRHSGHLKLAASVLGSKAVPCFAHEVAVKQVEECGGSVHRFDGGASRGIPPAVAHAIQPRKLDRRL